MPTGDPVQGNDSEEAHPGSIGGTLGQPGSSKINVGDGVVDGRSEKYVWGNGAGPSSSTSPTGFFVSFESAWYNSGHST